MPAELGTDAAWYALRTRWRHESFGPQTACDEADRSVSLSGFVALTGAAVQSIGNLTYALMSNLI